MIFTKEQRRAKFETLPEALKDMMVSEQTADATGRIAEKYALTDKQTPLLAREVGTVLLGLIPKEKLAEQLVVELQLPQEKAAAIAGEVEREIFSKNIPPPTIVGVPPSKGESKNSPLPARRSAGGEGSAPSPARGRDVLNIQNPPPTPSFIKPARRSAGGEGEAGGGFNAPPRPVPIRKELPPPPLRQISVGQATTTPTLQTILSDIRRGTAYDERRIEEAFRKTPVEVRQTLESVGFLSRLEGIAKKFGLNVEETGEMVSESGLVMLGLTLPVNFVDNLGKRLRLPRDRAMAVGQAVNMEVLRPVREILRKMGQPTPNTPPPPLRPEAVSPPYQRGEAEGVGLRFAPSVPTYSASAPFPRGSAERSEAKGWDSVQKPPPPPSQARGTPPYQGGEGKEKQHSYTTDPYREPIG